MPGGFNLVDQPFLVPGVIHTTLAKGACGEVGHESRLSVKDFSLLSMYRSYSGICIKVMAYAWPITCLKAANPWGMLTTLLRTLGMDRSISTCIVLQTPKSNILFSLIKIGLAQGDVRAVMG